MQQKTRSESILLRHMGSTPAEANGDLGDNLLNIILFEDSGMICKMLRRRCINGTNIAVAYLLMNEGPVVSLFKSI